MTTELDPTTFDVEAWLVDAQLPEESADVYKGGHIVAELSALKRRIENEEAVEDQERTAGDKAKLGKLEREYERLLKAFANSMLTVYVRALTFEERRELRAESDAATDGLDQVVQNQDYGYRLLSKCIIAVKPAGKDKVPATFTVDTVKSFVDALGDAQGMQVRNAYQTAQNAVPVVDADFLHKRSGMETGGE